MLRFVEKLRCADVAYDEEVFRSEQAHGFTNRALVNFMKGHGNINHAVDNVLDVYYHQCAIQMTCQDLARSFLFLANQGIVPATGERILTESQTKRINAVMIQPPASTIRPVPLPTASACRARAALAVA